MGLSGATVVGKGLEVESSGCDLRKASARVVCCKVDTIGTEGDKTSTVWTSRVVGYYGVFDVEGATVRDIYRPHLSWSRCCWQW